MKPIRLKLLIALLYSIALVIITLGLLVNSREIELWFPMNFWVSASLLFFFTAQLLIIPHNSGRIWAFFIAICIFVYSTSRVIIYCGLTETKADMTTFEGVYIPILLSLLGIQIIMLSFHSSVCVFYDSISIEVKQHEENTLKSENNSI